MASATSPSVATPLASLHVDRSSDYMSSHTVARVECAQLNRGMLIVAAGGGHISAGLEHEWFPGRAGRGGGVFSEGETLWAAASQSAILADGSRGLAEGVAMGGEKGAGDIHAAIESLLFTYDHEASASPSTRARGRSPPPLKLSSGHVTCLSVRVLPGGDGALGVVGTSTGSLCVFVADGESLAVLRECSLQEWSDGMITVQDVVRSIAIGLDPAGRLEFLAASTAHCALLVDIQAVDDGRAQARGTQAVLAFEQSWQKSRLATLKRARSATCVMPFVQAEVVRVLVPERFNAAFAFDIAAVLVFSDGTLRFVERQVRGGSVRLLQDHHARLQQASGMSAFAVDRTAGAEASAQAWQQETSLLTDARALPHVIYAYQLSTFQFNVSRAADEARFHARGVTVNDAALSYNARTGRMDLVLVGATQPSSTAGAATAAGSHQSLSALARLAVGAGLLATTRGATATGEALLSPQTAAQRLGWWAIARGAVLPMHTTRSILTKEQWYASAAGDTRSPEVLAATAADGSDAFVSAHTIHVQSSTIRLRRPRAPASTYPATVMPTAAAQAHLGDTSRSEVPSPAPAVAPVETEAPASAAVGGSSDVAVSAGSTAGGGGAPVSGSVDEHRSELSAVVVVRPNDLALIASGSELYVASLSDAPVPVAGASTTAADTPGATTALSALRHMRSSGTVCEDLACLSSAPTTGAKNGILAAGGLSVTLLTM